MYVLIKILPKSPLRDSLRIDGILYSGNPILRFKLLRVPQRGQIPFSPPPFPRQW